MISRALIFSFLLASPLGAEINDVVLEQIRTMPSGGGYATNLAAHQGLASSVTVFGLGADPAAKNLTRLLLRRHLPRFPKDAFRPCKKQSADSLAGDLAGPYPRLRPDSTDTLPDGESLWGRWNANGPGTARLFHELKLGRNFTDFADARPGDFMKIFWTDAVGKKRPATPWSFSAWPPWMASSRFASGPATSPMASARKPYPARRSPAPSSPASSIRRRSPAGLPPRARRLSGRPPAHRIVLRGSKK